jgi:hypothetical protein
MPPLNADKAPENAVATVQNAEPLAAAAGLCTAPHCYTRAQQVKSGYNLQTGVTQGRSLLDAWSHAAEDVVTAVSVNIKNGRCAATDPQSIFNITCRWVYGCCVNAALERSDRSRTTLEVLNNAELRASR